MHISDTIKKLESSKEFSSWKKTHKESYLAHAFKMLDEANEKIWQIGYFNPKTNLITVFVIDDTISKNKDEEVFQEQKKLVEPLDMNKVQIDDDSALNKAKTVLNDNYKGTSVFKSFMILQNLDKIGQVWNITFVTQQFKTVNVKINSQNGECISHKEVSLIQK